MSCNVLITGGLGYIGCHLYISLIEQGYKPYIIDDLSNSHRNVIKNLNTITNDEIKCYEGKVQDKTLLRKIIKENNIKSIFHLAAYKSIEESILFPEKYYDNNINSTLSILEVMSELNCNNLIFSSSACVYGETTSIPVKESDRLSHLNVYAHTKIICESIIENYCNLNKKLKYGTLRYFNPAGAHESGKIGEASTKKSKNLFPTIINLADNNQSVLNIFGSDYDTPDGTPIRDYIHIMDLVEGHIKILEYISKHKINITINLGTGKGQSVLEVIKIYNQIASNRLRYTFKERRLGDTGCCYADTSLANSLINWETKRSTQEIWESILKWKENYPNGYDY